MSLDAQNKSRFHNPKVGGSIPPPATKNFKQLTKTVRTGGARTTDGKGGVITAQAQTHLQEIVITDPARWPGYLPQYCPEIGSVRIY